MGERTKGDLYRHKGMRNQLVDAIQNKGISDVRILQAMRKIPRHLFLDKAFEEWAYKDVPFPIGNEQTISQPYTVAYQTDILKVEAGLKVLEIGTGSGYQACVLAEMGAKVYTIERHEALFLKTNELLKELGYSRIRTFHGDGTKGLSRFAPFDRILVTAGASEVPSALLDQLVVGGILVIPVGVEDQTMIRITKKSEKEYQQETFGRFRFVPFLKGVSRK